MDKMIVWIIVILMSGVMLWSVLSVTFQVFIIKPEFEKECYQKGGDYAWVSLNLNCLPFWCYTKHCYIEIEKLEEK